MMGGTASCYLIKVLMYLAVLCVRPCGSEDQPKKPACHLQMIKEAGRYEFIQEGDIMIGGVITLCRFSGQHKSRMYRCTCLSPQKYRYLVEFRFLIKEINENPARFPNVTLGYHIFDSCGETKRAIRNMLNIVSGTREPVPNYSCGRKRNIAGFIGDLDSEQTVYMAHILAYGGPPRTYLESIECAIPSICTIRIRPNTDIFDRKLTYTTKKNFNLILISYGATDPFLSDRATFPYFFRTVQSEEEEFIALCKLLKYFGWNWVGIIYFDNNSGYRDHQLLLKYLSSEGICVEFTIKLRKDMVKEAKKTIQKSSTGIVIICGDFSFTSNSVLFKILHIVKKKTSIVLSKWLNHLDGFESTETLVNHSLSFMQNRLSDHYDSSKFIKFSGSFHPSKYPHDEFLATLWDRLLNCLSEDMRKSDNVMGYLSIGYRNCSGEEKLTDIPGYLNYYHSPSLIQAVDMMTMAVEDMYNSNSQQMHGKDRWMDNYNYKIPRAQCSENCAPGYRKALKSETQTCCYDCIQCPEAEISNTTDKENCIRCRDMEWPNKKRTKCVAKTEDFLSYTNDMISAILTSISVFFFLLTVVILVVFILYTDTSIVRANNRSLSFLLLVSIKLSFLSVFLFLGRPVDITCMLRNITFGITFSIAVSSLLAKTIRVCVAFKATKPGSSWRKWVGVKLSNSVVLFCSSIQIIICMTWLAISPPFQELDLHTYPGTIIIQCNEGSAIGFYSVIGYMGLLAAVSFVLAFLARTLPDSFNEAKYITFSMLLFCSVWITMIPAYLSTKGKNTVCVEIFAILTSSAGLLFCIFLPKCYTILFRPEMNTKLKLLGNKS
ncbi:hypothetical protein XELAEV_18004638mg [Xenopus laevis]|uniref:G-protein coupled receptors family 3 profile domain-containing protein n=1 Tax=Xenopus laevis TaxID=8355 RepID=A0A974BR27_XENLA|nr:hypothetical protein XELAEV_18004638mg [Xenopus laevis]